MDSANDQEPETYRAEVDRQDGGPASHQEAGGAKNDVASGGVSECRNEDDDKDDDDKDNDGDDAVDQDRDVHGDADTVN